MKGEPETIMTNKLYVTIYLRETDLGILASRASQVDKAQIIADKLGIETNYEIDDYEGSLIFHVSAHRLEQLITALREADIRFGFPQVYDKAAFPIAEAMGG